MASFTDSVPLLETPDRLRARFEQDGYLYFPGVVDQDLLTSVRRDITEVCSSHGWFREDTDALHAIPRVEPRVEGEEPFLQTYDDIQRLESFHSVPHHPSVRRVIEPLLGPDAFPHPLGIARLCFPDDEWATPPHQDFPNNQGTTELYATWMPLSDCPVALGPLSILRGSHRLGLLPLRASLGAGHRRAELTPAHDQLEWLSNDMALGDVLVFHSLCVHRALPNRSDRMRLSVDYRFQAMGDPLTAGCLEPHFGRLTWEEIYAGWSRDDLKHYWRDYRYDVVPWDQHVFEVPEEDLVTQIREFVLWRRARPAVD